MAMASIEKTVGQSRHPTKGIERIDICGMFSRKRPDRCGHNRQLRNRRVATSPVSWRPPRSAQRFDRWPPRECRFFPINDTEDNQELELKEISRKIACYSSGIPRAACQTRMISMTCLSCLTRYTILHGLRMTSLIFGSLNSGTIRPDCGKAV